MLASSFGGIPLDIAALNIDYLISSANKCIQGVPGFAFVIARVSELETCKRPLALAVSGSVCPVAMCMEDNHGKWRFTSPTHTVLAFAQALKELAEEGGVVARHQRYSANQRRLVAGMLGLPAAAGRQPALTDHYRVLLSGRAAVPLQRVLSEAERAGLRYLSG